MVGLILFVHIVVSVLLIAVVLMQSSKGTGLASSVGGGMQDVFGSQGSASFLSKATTILAIVFMVTCLTLALVSKNSGLNKADQESIIKEAAKKGEFQPYLNTNKENKLVTVDSTAKADTTKQNNQINTVPIKNDSKNNTNTNTNTNANQQNNKTPSNPTKK